MGLIMKDAVISLQTIVTSADGDPYLQISGHVVSDGSAWKEETFWIFLDHRACTDKTVAARHSLVREWVWWRIILDGNVNTFHPPSQTWH